MNPDKNSRMRRLVFWAATITLTHLIAAVWHLVLLLKAQPDTPTLLAPLLIALNLLPVAGVAMFAKGFHKPAALMLAIPLGVALVIGGYAHFLSPGADNIFRMPAGGLTLAFQMSALLLFLLEIVGCGIGIAMFRHKPTKE